MHRDRDFDPDQLLVRRDKELRPGFRDQAPALTPLLPWNEQALRHDLGLDIVFGTMAGEDHFLFEVASVAILSGLERPDDIRYRQAVYRDCMHHEPVVRAIYDLAIEAVAGEQKHVPSYFSRYPAGTLHRAVDVLQMFAGVLRRLRSLADRHEHDFQSEAFRRLFAMLRQELSDDYLSQIERHLRGLKFRHGVLVSAELGTGNIGKDYVLRQPLPDQRNWIVRLLQKPRGLTYQLHPRDEAGARALSQLKDQGVNLVANAVAQSADHVLSFFQMLRTELAFYIGCLNLHHVLSGLNEPVCIPAPYKSGERALKAAGLYDVALALSARKTVVGNDVPGDGRDLFVITGANTGGKSTFLRSIGLAQLMMQAGMFGGADTFSAEIRAGVITHYRREEDASMESGKLDEELARMSEIVDHVTPDTMLLLNESFAATNEREGSEIARQIVDMLHTQGVKILFVTHLYDFARSIYKRNNPRALFLRADRGRDGMRTFRLSVAEPLQTSHGEDLYNQVFADGASAESRAVDIRASAA
jgi:hypothetical protein